jgi:hypothetical protein
MPATGDPRNAPPCRSGGATRPLVEVALDYGRAAATSREVFDAFLPARLWWATPPQPGLPVIRIEGEAVVPVFTSRAELVKFLLLGRPEAASESTFQWLSTDGVHLLSLLPPGVKVGLDLGSDHRLALDPAAATVSYSLVVAKGRPGAGSPKGQA